MSRWEPARDFGRVRAAGEAEIFNLQVDRHHTYFVGKTGYLVHNRKDEDPTNEGDHGDNNPDEIKSSKFTPTTPTNKT
jgi:hypothetical protein